MPEQIHWGSGEAAEHPITQEGREKHEQRQKVNEDPILISQKVGITMELCLQRKPTQISISRRHHWKKDK